MHIQNGCLLVDGEEVDWDSARLPLMSGSVLRSSSVFDGLLFNGSSERKNAASIVAGEAHIARLRRSCVAVGHDWRWQEEEVLEWCHVAAELEQSKTGCSIVYIRPMIVEGYIGHDQEYPTALTVAAFAQPSGLKPSEKRVIISSFRRPSSASLPASVKCVANYAITRIVRQEAASCGADDAILLNSNDRISEAAGAAILLELNGTIVTPPVWEDCLPSITVDIAEQIARQIGVPFQRRPVLPTELFASDGACLVGTLSAFEPVVKVGAHRLPISDALIQLSDIYQSDFLS